MQSMERMTGLGEEARAKTGLVKTGVEQAGMAAQERKRVEAVVETLARLGTRGESLAEVAHDARNMVTALGLYCDLLEEPGVLASPFSHYGGELRLVATASRRLVEKLVTLDSRQVPVGATNHGPTVELERPTGAGPKAGQVGGSHRWDLMPALPIDNLAAEVLATRNLLAALAGPAIAVTVDVVGGALGVRLTAEDLTRILVNLVKNASEAMPQGGRVQLGLRESPASDGGGAWLTLTIEDNGPGIPEQALGKIFESGYTTRARGAHPGGWPAAHRGLGLSITRSIVEAAGGRIFAVNRPQAGARFEIELPVTGHRVKGRGGSR